MSPDTDAVDGAAAAGFDGESLQLLATSLERYGHDRYSFEARKRWLGNAPGFCRMAWNDYAEMGWLALHLPVDGGGFGGDSRAIAALMRYAGEHLALEPLFASVVLCGGILTACHSPAARERLRALTAGSRIFALAHAEGSGDGMDGGVETVARDGCVTGRKIMVLHGDVADELLLTARVEGGDGLALYALDTGGAGVRRTSLRLLDGRGAASFDFAAAPGTLITSADALRASAGPTDTLALLQTVLDDARLALCAEAHGAMRVLNRDTLAYLKARHQFGRPLGSNQVLQHRMTELYMLEQEAAAVISAAQRAKSVVAPGGAAVRDMAARRAISGAVAHCIRAGRQIAHEAVQFHGGIGTTDELPVSHYFKRIMVLNRLLGDRDAHLDAFVAADAAGAASAAAAQT